MTPDAQQPSPFNDLAYATGRWEIYRQDAGMGEKDYCVLRNGGFFCRTDDLNAAKNICAAIDRSRPHTPAPAPETISKELALELCMDARKEAARAATIAERQKWIDALNTLISTESVRLSPTMVNMTYREAAVLAVADEPVEP